MNWKLVHQFQCSKNERGLTAEVKKKPKVTSWIGEVFFFLAESFFFFTFRFIIHFSHYMYYVYMACGKARHGKAREKWTFSCHIHEAKQVTDYFFFSSFLKMGKCRNDHVNLGINFFPCFANLHPFSILWFFFIHVPFFLAAQMNVDLSRIYRDFIVNWMQEIEFNELSDELQSFRVF